MKDRNGVEVRVGDRVKVVDYDGSRRVAERLVGQYVVVTAVTAPPDGRRYLGAKSLLHLVNTEASGGVFLHPREIELPVTTVIARSLNHAR